MTASGCLLPCRQPSGKLVLRARSRRTVGKRRAVLYDAPLCAPAWKRWEGTGPCRPAVWLFRKDTPGPRAHTPSRATQTAARDAAGCCGDSVCMFKAMKCLRRTGQSEEVCSRSSRRTLRNRPSTTALPCCTASKLQQAGRWRLPCSARSAAEKRCAGPQPRRSMAPSAVLVAPLPGAARPGGVRASLVLSATMARRGRRVRPSLVWGRPCTAHAAMVGPQWHAQRPPRCGLRNVRVRPPVMNLAPKTQSLPSGWWCTRHSQLPVPSCARLRQQKAAPLCGSWEQGLAQGLCRQRPPARPRRLPLARPGCLPLTARRAPRRPCYPAPGACSASPATTPARCA